MLHAAAVVALAASISYQIAIWVLVAQGYVARSVLVASTTGRVVLGALTLALLVTATLAWRHHRRNLAILAVGILGALAFLRAVIAGFVPSNFNGWFALHTISWWLGIVAAVAVLVLWFRERPAEA